MEIECILWLSGLVAFVYGYTPTFRNEATHPLKAPTESTLGLQMSDESAGRTRSNAAKADQSYFAGGKHFEYMLLNDSGVLLTSLQNDGPSEVGAQQTAASADKDGYSTKSNFVDHDGFNGDGGNSKVSVAKPNHSSAAANAISSQSAVAARKNGFKSSAKDSSPSETTSKKFGNSVGSRFSGANRASNANDPKKAGSAFGFDKMPDISSTTKLYSKQANKSAENFASFTSPLAAKPMTNGYGSDEDEAPATQQKSVAGTNRTKNDRNSSQRQSFDYDDSFTKLLISNGILRPDSNSSSSAPSETTETSTTLRSVSDVGRTNDANPSAEDINRIMDGRIVALLRNGTETRNLLSSLAAPAEGSASKPQIKSTQTVVSASPSSRNEVPVQLSVKSILTGVFEKSTTTKAASSNFPTLTAEKLDIYRSTATDSSSSTRYTSDTSAEIVVSPSTLQIDDETATTYESNFTAPDATTHDTGVPTSTPTEQHPKLNLPADRVNGAKNYETTEAKTISASAEFVHTDESNENPLAAKTYTDLSSNVESDTENSFLNDEYLPAPERRRGLHDDDNDNGDDDSDSVVINNGMSRITDVRIKSYTLDRFPSLNQLFSMGGAGGVGVHEVKKKNAPSTERSLSVSEFKGLIEDSVRYLFYFVARHIREHTLVNADTMLRNSADSKVTLKRFGFVNVADTLNKSSADFDPLDVHWIDLADDARLTVSQHLGRLFDEDDENVRWIVFVGLNSTFARVQKDFVRYADSTLAARLSLEYCGLKINAVIVVPSDVATNVTLPERESSIDVNEELAIAEPDESATNTWLELSDRRYRVLQLFSDYPRRWSSNEAAAPPPETRPYAVDTKHDDIELYIYVFLGAVSIFGVLSPILYAVYRVVNNHTANVTFKMPSVFRDKFQYQSHEKMPESRCESLNVIFSEEFDRKYSSWFDNTQHSSSILRASAEGGPSSGGAVFNDTLDDYPEFSDLTRNVCENSPRLNKENRLNMGCRPSCVLLPHPSTYLIQSENEERYFDNPNYSR